MNLFQNINTHIPGKGVPSTLKLSLRTAPTTTTTTTTPIH